MEAGSFVVLIAASTLLRLGVLPDLKTDAIASSTTCVAANTGGPNVPKDPYFDFAAATIAPSAGSARMSRPNQEATEPFIGDVRRRTGPSGAPRPGLLCFLLRVPPTTLPLA